MGRKIKYRREFKFSTKKNEWMRAAGRDPFDTFVKTSKCRRCKRSLKWGDRTYEFDHKDNNPANNSQKNCYLVCKICHGKATVIKKKKITDKFTGMVIGHQTIKKKVGYKKITRKKVAKKKPKRKLENYFGIEPTKLPRIRI